MKKIFQKTFVISVAVLLLISIFLKEVRAGGWTTTTIEHALVGSWRSTSITLDSSNNYLVSYFYTTTESLKFAKSTDGGDTWVTKTVATGLGSNGGSISITIDKLGNYLISYYDYMALAIKFAKSTDGGDTWVTKTVQVEGRGYGTTINVDSNNNYLIAYYYGTAPRAYKIAESTDGGDTWSSKTIEAITTSGTYNTRFIDFAIDSQDNYIVSYYDSNNMLQKFAKSTDGGDTWVTKTIATYDNDYDPDTNIKIDSLGNYLILYYNGSDNNLKFAKSTNGGDNWSFSTVANIGVMKPCPSFLRIDSSNNYLVSYNTGDYFLKMATSTNGGTDWSTETITELSPVTGYISLAVTASDDYLISYTITDRSVKLAKWVESTPPTISLTPYSPDPTTNTKPVFTGTATDTGGGTVSSVEFQIDGTSGSWTACTADDGAFDEATEAFTCTVTSALSDGGHTMYVRATDSNGNVTASGSESTDSFTVDTVAPLDFSLVSPDDKAYTSSSHPNFCFKTTTDATSGVSHYELSIGGTTKVSDIKPTCQGGVNYYDCRIEKSATSTTSPISWGRYEDSDRKIDYFGEKICVEWKQEDRNLKEGTHYWKVKAVDYAGNSRSTGERILYVDYDYVSTTPTPTPTPTFFFGSYLLGSDESANLEIVDIKKEKLKKKEKPTSYVSLTVKVVDQKGSPVEGASITLFSTPRNAKTNKEGVATFEKVEKGKHRLLVKQDGYQGSENLDLTDSQVKAYVITVKLEKIDNYIPFIIIAIILLCLFFFVVKIYMGVVKKAK